MKIKRRTEAGIVFHLSNRETGLLLSILRLYPRLPPAHQQVSRLSPCPDAAETQRLLDEALAEQRAENRSALERLLKDPERFKEQVSGWTLSLSHADIEWLLQVLNEIRVGSWVLLGSPEHKVYLNPKNAAQLWAMEMSGHFQMQFLSALEGNQA